MTSHAPCTAALTVGMEQAPKQLFSACAALLHTTHNAGQPMLEACPGHSSSVHATRISCALLQKASETALLKLCGLCCYMHSFERYSAGSHQVHTHAAVSRCPAARVFQLGDGLLPALFERSCCCCALAAEIHGRRFWQPGGLYDCDVPSIAAGGPQQLLEYDAGRLAAMQHRRWVNHHLLTGCLQPVGVCMNIKTTSHLLQRTWQSSLCGGDKKQRMRSFSWQPGFGTAGKVRAHCLEGVQQH